MGTGCQKQNVRYHRFGGSYGGRIETRIHIARWRRDPAQVDSLAQNHWRQPQTSPAGKKKTFDRNLIYMTKHIFEMVEENWMLASEYCEFFGAGLSRTLAGIVMSKLDARPTSEGK